MSEQPCELDASDEGFVLPCGCVAPCEGHHEEQPEGDKDA